MPLPPGGVGLCCAVLWCGVHVLCVCPPPPQFGPDVQDWGCGGGILSEGAEGVGRSVHRNKYGPKRTAPSC